MPLIVNEVQFQDLQTLFKPLESLFENYEPSIDFKDKVLVQYIQWVISNLKPIMEETHNTEMEVVKQKFISFLGENWDLVKGSMLSPTAIPNADVTKLLSALAMFVDNTNPLSLLMTDISVEPVSNGFPLLRQCAKEDIEQFSGVFMTASKRVDAVISLEKERINKLKEALQEALQEASENPELYPKVIEDINAFFVARDLTPQDTPTSPDAYAALLDKYLVDMRLNLGDDLEKLDRALLEAHQTLLREIQIQPESWAAFSRAVEATNQFLLDKYPHIPNSDMAVDIGQIQFHNEEQTQHLGNSFKALVPAFTLEAILRTHILSDDNQSLIPIISLASGESDKARPYAEDYTMISDNELTRLGEHSDKTRALVLALEKLSTLEKGSSDNLLSQLKFLCKVLKNEDAHEGRGTQEKVGELAFPALVGFFEFYEKISKKIDQIPPFVRDAIKKLKQVSGDFSVNMVANIQTCAGSRREQIERAMIGNDAILAGISIDVEEHALQLAEQFREVEGLKNALKALISSDSGSAHYQDGFDHLGINKKILKKLNIDFTIENSRDFLMFKQLAADDIRELLSDNDALQQSILRQITSLENLVLLSHEMSEPKLRVIFEFLAHQLKQSYVKCSQDKIGLIMTLEQNFEKLKLMIDFFDINISDVRSDFIHPETVRLLLNKPGIDVNAKDVNGYTPLIWAARNSHTQIVEQLLTIPSIDVNLKTIYGDTALMWAARNGHTQIVEQLLANDNINLNLQDKDGKTALMWAARNGHTQIVEQLLAKDNIDVNLKDKDGKTALMWAAATGHTQIVTALLTKHGINLNSQNNNGDTALMWAAANGYIETVKALLAKDNIDVNLKDKDGTTALMWAAEKGYTQIVEQLLAIASIDVNAKDVKGTPLIEAARKGHTQIIQQLLAKDNIDVNLQDKDGKTALMWAAATGHTQIVTALLTKHGINLNSQNNNGDTALMWAAANGNTQIVEQLLAKDNIDVNLQDKDGKTALMWAAATGHTQIVTALLTKHGINLNSQNNNGDTALMWAAEKGNTQIVEQLLAKDNIDVNLQNSLGKNPLMLAVEKKDLELVKALLQRPDIDVNLKTKQRSPVEKAISLARSSLGEQVRDIKIIQIIQLLLQRPDIDVNYACNWNNDTLLTTEVGFSEPSDIFDELLKCLNINVNLKNREGYTALMIALEGGNSYLIKKLLGHNDIEVNVNNKLVKKAFQNLKKSDLELFNQITKKIEEQNVYKPHLKKYIERAQTIKNKDISEDLKISFVDLIHQLSKLNAHGKYSDLMFWLLQASEKLPKTNSNSVNNNQDLIDFAKSCLKSINKINLAKHTNWPEVVFKCVLAFFVFPVFIYLLATKRLLKSDFAIARDKFIGKLKDIESNNSNPKP